MRVRDEPDRLPHGRAAADIRKVRDDGWIKQRAITDARVARIIGVNLDKGESEAIALAVELSADLVLLDETDGRRAAERAAAPARRGRPPLLPFR